MENQNKTKKKFYTKPVIILFMVAILFFILGLVDIKVNAAESDTYVSSELDFVATMFIYEDSSCTTLFKGYPQIRQNVSYVSGKPISVYYYQTFSTPSGGEYEHYAYLVSQDHIYSNGELQESGFFESNGVTYYYAACCMLSTGFSSDNPGFFKLIFSGSSELYKLNSDKYKPDAYGREQFVKDIQNGVLDSEQIIDWVDFILSADVNDDMPIVESLEFDRIESTENSVKKITDYIRFKPNNAYKLVIMLCPSVYSAFESSGYINEFKNYQYDKWIYMTTADKGLKEISCELGSFSIPTNGVESIISSSYKDYYNSILYDLNGSGNLNFKPTMGYRLMYVDLENNMIGPCTYVLPNYYNNLDTDSETYSYFTLYSDNTRGSEKIMNLKTWEQDENTTIEDVKEIIVSVENVLKDKVVVDNDVDIYEASNWLYSVVNFIGDTPHLIGVVLPFLPKPILYGLYVTVFLGVIASGIAIVKALLP